MLRQFLAVITGFAIWSVLWLVYNIFLRTVKLLPSNIAVPVQNSGPLVLLLLGSIGMSCLSGWIGARIVRGASNVPIWVLGLLLLAVGIFFQTQYWHLMPLWYHLSFLAMLVPGCFMGARLVSP